MAPPRSVLLLHTYRAAIQKCRLSVHCDVSFTSKLVLHMWWLFYTQAMVQSPLLCDVSFSSRLLFCTRGFVHKWLCWYSCLCDELSDRSRCCTFVAALHVYLHRTHRCIFTFTHSFLLHSSFNAMHWIPCRVFPPIFQTGRRLLMGGAECFTWCGQITMPNYNHYFFFPRSKTAALACIGMSCTASWYGQLCHSDWNVW